MNAKKSILIVISKAAAVVSGLFGLLFIVVGIDMLNENVAGAVVSLVIAVAFVFATMALVKYSKNTEINKPTESESITPETMDIQEQPALYETHEPQLNRSFKYDALVIDFETATEQNNSACSIGLALN